MFLFGEHIEIANFPKIFDSYFWFAMFISGILGFSMGYVTSLQIQVTSPLSHNVSGTAKAYAQTLLGVFYFHEVKTTLWWMSNVLVLAGAALYSHVRSQEMKAAHKTSNPNLLETGNAKQSGMVNENEESNDNSSLLLKFSSANLKN